MIEGALGVTEIEIRTAVVTLSVVELLIPVAGSVAVIEVDPTATLVASPLLPRALLTVAVVVVDELHVAEVVRFCVELSL